MKISPKKSKSPAKRKKKRKPAGPNPAAVALGRLGGLARKKSLSPERASEIGRRAIYARYGKPWPPPPDTPGDVSA